MQHDDLTYIYFLKWFLQSGKLTYPSPHMVIFFCMCVEKKKSVAQQVKGLPWWLRWWRVHLQCGRPAFDQWVRKIPWRREWQPTPAFLPGEFCGQRSLVGYSLWGWKELMTMLNVYSLRKFEVQDTVLLTIVTMLSIRSSEIIQLIDEVLYHLTTSACVCSGMSHSLRPHGL